MDSLTTFMGGIILLGIVFVGIIKYQEYKEKHQTH